MAKILALTNQKGGVGKTTSCVNLAASLAATKRRVLLVDLDPQGNATMGCGVDKHELPLSVYDVLVGHAPVRDAIVPSEAAGIEVLPSNGDLTAAEVELINSADSEGALSRALEDLRGDYDFILVDCPPSLNMLTVNALVAADGVIIPMQCEYYALEGLAALMDTISGISSTRNPKLHIEGLLRTMYDPRNSLTVEVSRQLIAHFGNKVYRTVIPRNVRLAEAPSHGLPVIKYDKHSRGAIAYLALAGELIRRQDAGKVRQQPEETAVR
ncbi:ParA family protein [Parendozoicomonas haliclonae]|uniref:Chromosome partitioning protein ParA n=1 Tax=Parendozoicomonas haliclonae TaxID=1960125 RepID=A0A1X7AJW2_9GAMM|nr:ParA family protein [Parendozoicomonas haliclonae]SMA46542.1 Chromosome partitioning protein ParA [Parendozoicomonas haliclonae]